MQSRHTTVQELFAEPRDDLFTKLPDAFPIVPVAFHLPSYPLRDFCTTIVGKTGEAREVDDRHDPRHDGDSDAVFPAPIDVVKIGVRIKKVLGKRAICTGIHLEFEVFQFTVDVR